jgi:SAM-dependent methyltransferase
VIGSLARSPLARRLARSGADWVDLQLSLIVSSLRDVAPLARGRLLDVGCGNKPYEPIFRPYVSEFLGIEHEATFVKTSASNQAASAATTPDFTYDGEHLPFPGESFDTVLNVQVLEHTPRPRRLIGEIGRVLKRNGLLILVAPFSFRLHEQPHDYFRYTSHGLRHLLDEAGVEVDEIRQHGGLWSVIGHKLNSYLAFRVGRVGALGQSLGKLGHEESATLPPRLWALPFVGASMAAVAVSARVLDRVLAEPDETLSFLVLAHRR